MSFVDGTTSIETWSLKTVPGAAVLFQEISRVYIWSAAEKPWTDVLRQRPTSFPFDRRVGWVRVPRFEDVQFPDAGVVDELTITAPAETNETPGGAFGIPPAELCGGTDANVPITKEPRVRAATEARTPAPIPSTTSNPRGLRRLGAAVRTRR